MSGFTIIELMIAMTILAFISMGIYSATTETYRRRDQTEQEGDFYNSIRVALDVMGRDISAMYTPQGEALPGDLGKAPPPEQPGQAPGQARRNQAGYGGYGGYGGGGANNALTDFWGEPINEHGVRPSRFQGDEKKISFISSSHMRLYRDSAESEIAKIRYTLEEPKVKDPLMKGKVLVKHEDPAFYTESTRDSETEQSFALLENVKDITFEYLDGEKDSWSKRWDTASADHKDIPPSVIKVTLEIFMPASENTFTVVQQFRQELQKL